MMLFSRLLFGLFAMYVHYAAAGEAYNDGPIRSTDFDATVNRVLVDQSSGTIYVGATNFIHILTPDLSGRQSKPTNGWVKDSRCSSQVEVDTGGMGMVLMTIDDKVVLIACGTACRGHCVSMTANRYYVNPINITILPFQTRTNDSFCMFAGHGPQHDVLYVGSEHSGLPSHLKKPLILRQSFNLEHHRSPLKRKDCLTRICLNPKWETTDSVRFIFGFSDENYAYFLTTQRIGMSDIETKLGRISRKDKTLSSYAQIPLHCSHGKFHYSIAQTAHFETGKITNNSTTLFVAFALTTSDEKGSVNSAMGSVICQYDVSYFDNYLNHSLYNVYNESHPSSASLKNFSERKPRIERNEPGSKCSPYFDGKFAMSATSVLQYPQDIVTSLAVTVQNSEMVYFVGTERGSLFKDTGTKRALIEVKFSGAIKPGASFSPDGRYIYAAGGKQVKRIPLDTCSFHVTCETCVSKEDSSDCGWCIYNCSSSTECEYRNQSEYFSNKSCAPKVFDFLPKSGPIGGETQVTIFGQQFSNKTKETRNKDGSSIAIAGKTCEVNLWTPNEIQCFITRTQNPMEGPLAVVFESPSKNSTGIPGYTSRINFSFVTPYINRIVPTYGPLAGGTKVDIYGKHLNSGKQRSVKLGDDNCLGARIINDNHIVCLTNQSLSTQGLNMHIEIDEAVFTSNLTFEYLPNPVVYKDSLNGLETTGSCSINLTFRGKHLNSVANPYIFVHVTYDNSTYQLNSPCSTAEDGTRMTCRPPTFPGAYNLSTKVRGLASLMLDGVDEYSNINLTYKPDPVFVMGGLESIALNVNDGTVLIYCKHLSLKYKPEVNLKSREGGTKKCVVDEDRSSETVLLCRVPTEEVASLTKVEWNVTVVIGDLVHQMGSLKFYEPDGQEPSLFISWGIALLPVLLVAFALIVYHRHNSKIGKMTSLSREFSLIPREPSSSTNNYNANISSDQTIRKPFKLSTASPEMRLVYEPLFPSVTFNLDNMLKLLANENLLISREFINFERILGEGHFGRVYKGSLKLSENKSSIDIAVKTLHLNGGGFQNFETESLLEEGMLMKDFNHCNVLSLIGVSFDHNHLPMVVLPFMAFGDLLSHLRNREHNFGISDLLTYAIHVADGMEYLSRSKFVHRDLAARNCVVDQNGTVKIADFGLSRDIHVKDYYRSHENTKPIPVRWMAIESIERLIYDTKTDVWSYGVLLWEIITRGVTPYPGVENCEILSFLRQGNRMLRSHCCPLLLYKTMIHCWDESPNSRPTFPKLAVDIRAVAKKLQSERENKTGLTKGYVSIYEVQNVQKL